MSVKSGEVHNIISTGTTLTVPDEITALIAEAKDLQAKIDRNESLLRNSDLILCPVCQKGYLNTHERRKILGIISDKWFTCGDCAAEFDKKLSKAKLVKSNVDPYGVFKKYGNQTLSMDEWRTVVSNRINSENYDYKEEISGIKSKIVSYLMQQLRENKFQFMLVDPTGFLLKKDEKAIFGTKAEIIEERKRRITQRTTTGSRRNYGGFSFRVAKGVYYHTGASSAATPRQTSVQSTEYTELVSADSGDFIITNQRVLFRGNRSRGLSIPINKIAAIQIDPGENAVMIVQENKKPAILKLLTNVTSKVSDLEISMSVDLQYIIDLIKSA